MLLFKRPLGFFRYHSLPTLRYMTKLVVALVKHHLLPIITDYFVEELLEKGEPFLVDFIDVMPTSGNLCSKLLFFFGWFYFPIIDQKLGVYFLLCDKEGVERRNFFVKAQTFDQVIVCYDMIKCQFWGPIDT